MVGHKGETILTSESLLIKTPRHKTHIMQTFNARYSITKSAITVKKKKECTCQQKRGEKANNEVWVNMVELTAYSSEGGYGQAAKHSQNHGTERHEKG